MRSYRQDLLCSELTSKFLVTRSKISISASRQPRYFYLPTPAEMCAYVWYYVNGHHDHRPTVEDLAKMLGTNSRTLRRRWKGVRRTSLRSLISYGCLTFGWWQIYAMQEKATAAARIAGFSSYWHFNRLSKKHGVGTASRYRDHFHFQLNWEDFTNAFKRLHTIETQHLSDGPADRYALIESLESAASLTLLCRHRGNSELRELSRRAEKFGSAHGEETSAR